ncbi:TPA: hypothetical protein JD342_14805 [Citrobacter freundii]|nr:hypothetical protein [Citrobacter freundii]
MSFNLFDECCQFSSILSLVQKRDTYHIDETSSSLKNNLREINNENYQICCCRCCPVYPFFWRFRCRTCYGCSGAKHE